MTVVKPVGRVERWIWRLDRVAGAVHWFIDKVLVAVLLVLLVVGSVWYFVLKSRTPDPWSGPDATGDAFGWQVWAAGAAAVIGLAGLFLTPYVKVALAVPFAVLSWILARFRPDDRVRGTIAGLPERAAAMPGRAAAMPGRARAAIARSAYTRADLVAPLRAALRRPMTWLLAAGGIVLVVVLVVGTSTLLDLVVPRATAAPPTAAEIAAMEQQVRAKAMEVHAVVGAPPIHRNLRFTPTTCDERERRAGDPSHVGFGYLATRPGVDPVDRMSSWAAELRTRGWAVTHPYPVARRTGTVLDDRILLAVSDGFEIKIDATYPPDLWIEVRGVC
jgi:hypothetical protein